MQEWQARPPLQVGRAGHDVATVGGRIVVAGGFGPDLVQPQVFRSAEVRGAGGAGVWHTLPPMKRRRSNLAVAGTETGVYAIGGVTLAMRIRASVERFEDGAWHDAPRLPVRRTRAGAAALGGLIYVVGGIVPPAGAATKTAVVLDPDMGGWRKIAPIRRPRHSLRLVAAGQHLYAIGGLTTNDEPVPDVERYDPESDEWTTVTPMERPRALPGAVTVRPGEDTAIVVVGGVRSPQPGVYEAQRTTELYRVADDKWHLLDVRLPQPRASLVCATTAGHTVLAIGGEINGETGEVTDSVLALQLT